MHSYERPRIRIPSPVHAVVNVVKMAYFLIANTPYLKVLKYLTTTADWFTKVFMPVLPLVRFFQELRFRKELLAQPFLRSFKVCTLVAQPISSFFQAIQVCPTITGNRRIIALEVPKRISTTHR